MSLKVKITSTSIYFVEWGCLDSNRLEGFNNLGMKRVASLVQIHAPTSSFENEPIFTEFDEDSTMPNSVSHNSDDSSNGHNNVPIANLCTLGRNGHDNHPNFLHWDVVDVEGVFVAKGRIIACDPREAMFDDDLGDHVGIVILYCPNDILVVMSIWRWLLSQTIFHGHSLKALN